MILVSLGSNLPSIWGNPEETLNRAIAEMEMNGIHILKKSPIIKTEPIGTYAGDAYANAVVELGKFIPPQALLRRLKWIEHRAGRHEARYASVLGRLPRWRPRTLDLDILDWHGIKTGPEDERVRTGFVPLTLPHPALHERAFIKDLIEHLT